MPSVRSYQVTLTVTGTVIAESPYEAVDEMCGLVRSGLGRDTTKRKFGAKIAHGEALCKSVFIPERSPDATPQSAETA
jgi:hypothetical protein